MFKNFEFTPIISICDRKSLINDIYKNSSYILKNIIENYYDDNLVDFLTDLLTYIDLYDDFELTKVNNHLRSLILQYDYIVKNFHNKMTDFFIEKI